MMSLSDLQKVRNYIENYVETNRQAKSARAKMAQHQLLNSEDIKLYLAAGDAYLGKQHEK